MDRNQANLLQGTLDLLILKAIGDGEFHGGHYEDGSRLTSALRTLLRKQRVETELDMEIRSYVDAVADEKIESGISPTEARRQALAESGGIEQVKQAVREQRASTTVESVYPGYSLRAPPDAAQSRFYLDSGDHPWLGNRSHHRDFFRRVCMLIRPLPYPGSDRLMEISEASPKETIRRASQFRRISLPRSRASGRLARLRI